ncbi:MAG: hypothetical protein CMO55_21970 [Verrucomicrobiales bacterium]|nr:hypothetical protein [Verrucomicrobiales bacterium]
MTEIRVTEVTEIQQIPPAQRAAIHPFALLLRFQNFLQRAKRESSDEAATRAWEFHSKTNVSNHAAVVSEYPTLAQIISALGSKTAREKIKAAKQGLAMIV